MPSPTSSLPTGNDSAADLDHPLLPTTVSSPKSDTNSPSSMMKHVLPPRRDARFLHLVLLIVATAVLLLSTMLASTPQTAPAVDMNPVLRRLERIENAAAVPLEAPSVDLSGAKPKQLIFYNRPPKTGSTTVRIAMKKALDSQGLRAAKCFNMIEWNEMGLKTIINHRDVDFYGCHTRLTPHRYRSITHMRGGNVTFVTNTRDPKNIILSAYLQENRGRNVAAITDDAEVAKELERYREHVEKYPVDALYRYHGADVPLTKCPAEWLHIDAMRRVAERYEVVIDLARPTESTAMVEAVTGLTPDFGGHYNERTRDMSGKMLSALSAVDTSHKTCGNELVHQVLMQQFNIIKDRLMQNRCFSEESGTFKLCEQAKLSSDEIRERTRSESYEARSELMRMAKDSK